MNAFAKVFVLASELLWEQHGLDDAQTLFDSSDINRAAEAKFGAAALHTFIPSVWMTDEEKEDRAARAQAALSERRQ